MSSINKQACDKLKSAAAKAVDNFAPNMFVETRDVLALLGELGAAEKRIAELEAREVALPQRISMEGGAYCTAHARYDEDGDFYYRDEVIESLVAAGIITKVGE